MNTLELRNLDRFADPATVAFYASGSEGLSPTEAALIRRWVWPGSRILDLGVGAGRTTASLARRSVRYVGLDYAEPMIEVCRRRFPDREFVVRDAADLSGLDDQSFDVVVFSFNGLGCLSTDGRRRCLSEVRRVLIHQGVFIWSIHNPRALLPPLGFGRDHRRRTPRALRPLAYAAVMARRAWRPLPRLKCLVSAPFWTGSGELHVSAHGGLLIWLATPSRVIRELNGFRIVDCLAYPLGAGPLGALWYYYVAKKV